MMLDIIRLEYNFLVRATWSSLFKFFLLVLITSHWFRYVSYVHIYINIHIPFSRHYIMCADTNLSGPHLNLCTINAAASSIGFPFHRRCKNWIQIKVLDGSRSYSCQITERLSLINTVNEPQMYDMNKWVMGASDASLLNILAFMITDVMTYSIVSSFYWSIMTMYVKPQMWPSLFSLYIYLYPRMKPIQI